jgi:hypothetical protein
MFRSLFHLSTCFFFPSFSLGPLWAYKPTNYPDDGSSGFNGNNPPPTFVASVTFDATEAVDLGEQTCGNEGICSAALVIPVQTAIVDVHVNNQILFFYNPNGEGVSLFFVLFLLLNWFMKIVDIIFWFVLFCLCC